MIRTLIASDIPGLNKLPPADWNSNYEAFLIDYLKESFFDAFVLIEDDKIVATGNVFLDDTTGWLANIITDQAYRNRGLGYTMTKYLVDFLESKGCETQLLIATELGSAVYTKLGFQAESEYICFESEIDSEYNLPTFIRPLLTADLAKVYELDIQANDENRHYFIDKFYQTGFGYFNNGNNLVGFYLPDYGRGLVIANTEIAGLELLKFKHSKKGRKTLLPIENTVGIEYFNLSGCKQGTPLSRMILGKPKNWNPSYIYSYGTGYRG